MYNAIAHPYFWLLTLLSKEIWFLVSQSVNMRPLRVQNPFSPPRVSVSWRECCEDSQKKAASDGTRRKRECEDGHEEEDDVCDAGSKGGHSRVAKGSCGLYPGSYALRRDGKRSLWRYASDGSFHRSGFLPRSYPPSDECRMQMVKRVKGEGSDLAERSNQANKCYFKRSGDGRKQRCLGLDGRTDSVEKVRRDRQEEKRRFIKDLDSVHSASAPLIYVRSVSDKHKQRMSNVNSRALEDMTCQRTGNFWEAQLDDKFQRSEGSTICSVESGELLETDHESHLEAMSKYICEATTPESDIVDKLLENRSAVEENHAYIPEVGSSLKEDFPDSLDSGDPLGFEAGFYVRIMKRSKAKYYGSILNDKMGSGCNTEYDEMIDVGADSCEPSPESPEDRVSALVIQKASASQRSYCASNAVQHFTDENWLWKEGINSERMPQKKLSSPKDKTVGSLKTVCVADDQNIGRGEDEKIRSVIANSECSMQSGNCLLSEERSEKRTSPGHSNRPVVIDCTDKFKLQVPQVVKERPRETDPHRLSQRQRQIQFGKNTLGYERYSQLIPRCKRRFSDPHTPDFKQTCSKRSWSGQIRKWRRLLHIYDPPLLEGEELAVDLSQGALTVHNLNQKESDQTQEFIKDENLNLSIYGDWDEMEE